MLVLRAGPPPGSQLLAGPFLHLFFESTFERQKYPKSPPEGPKCAPTAPQMTQNPCPRHPKSNLFGRVKTLKNRCFYCGLGTLGGPGVDVFIVKTAIVAPTAHRTPQNGENGGPMAPKVAQASPNGARGGGITIHFLTFFRPETPNGARTLPSRPRVPIFTDFWSILGGFLVIFTSI